MKQVVLNVRLNLNLHCKDFDTDILIDARLYEFFRAQWKKLGKPLDWNQTNYKKDGMDDGTRS